MAQATHLPVPDSSRSSLYVRGSIRPPTIVFSMDLSGTHRAKPFFYDAPRVLQSSSTECVLL